MTCAFCGSATARVINGSAKAAEIIKDCWGSPAELISKARYTEICVARDEAAWRMRYELRLGLAEIGAYLNRHHSSIINSIQNHKKRMVHE